MTTPTTPTTPHRHRTTRRLAAAAVSVLTTVTLAACGNGGGSTASGGTPVPGGRLKIAFWSDLQNCVDPNQVYWIETRSLDRNIADSLTDQDPSTGKIVPWLANSWTVSPDASEYTFSLRKGVTFSDGTTLDAAAVKTAFDGLHALGAKSTLGLSYLANYKATTVVDPTTVKVAFKGAAHLDGIDVTYIAEDSVRVGLDDPVPGQYFRPLWDALHLDFGLSLTQNTTVGALLADKLPTTLALAAVAVVLMAVLGVTVAYLASYLQWGPARALLPRLPAVAISLPPFFVGLLLIQIFAFSLGWFPATGTDGWRSLVLPALTLFGVLVGHMVANAVVVETVFSRSGIGLLAQQSVLSQDVPVVQAIVLIAAALFVTVNLLVDLLYSLLDPRVAWTPRVN
ncbi:ABC transporter substrate-binding protein [Frankia sp. BMG5.23]|uniref:ABC transporter substrate-binding protein n=1 Tax=Frankia sp. BMG5.23 TaxID=683305 RepID=UPI0004611513|nr:ABC transporter substrate-binding protein [Frankia sp. BMG5.23]KDA42732.1 hypothetical protein BMG523Draft_02432 [Frankia sp. BMG5.23]